MTTRFRDLSIEEYWNLTWPFLSVLGVGLAIRTIAHWHPIDVLEALGDALMVAGAIGAAFELFATRFLIERVANDLSEKLVGRGLPSELQSRIRKIVDTDFVRDHYVKAYSISNSQHSGSLVLEIRVSFDVKNYSDSSKVYTPVVQEETFYRPEFTDLEYGIVAGEFHNLDPAKLLRATQTDPKTNVKTVCDLPGIKIEPFRRNEKAVCTVRFNYRLQMPEEYVDVTNFAGATIGATIRIDQIPDTIDFVSTGDHTDGSKSWYFPDPFIAGQHIRAWWFRKKPI